MRTPAEITRAAQKLVGATGWAGWCEKFTRTAFGFPARYPSARAAYLASKKAGTIHTDTNPPAGVPVFWDITTGPNAAYDHVAVSIGGGKVVSTSVGKNRTPAVIGVNELTKLWGMKYLGWAEFYHGQRVYTPAALPAWYCVNVGRSATLLGRTGPSTKHKIIHRRKRGFQIYAVKIVKGGGREWAVTKYGTHYALEYLKKGKTL